MAIPTIPPCVFGGATVEPSGVEADTPTPSVDGGGSPANRDLADAASWRC